MAFSYDTVTIDSEAYEVFASLDYAENYASAVFGATSWSDATDANKNLALVTATRTMNRQNWIGEKADSDNELEWPRSNIEGVADDAIPDKLKEATVELAISILAGSTVQTSITTENLSKRLKAGSVEIENFRSTAGNNLRFPLPVQELIGQWLTAFATVRTGPASGVDEKSRFTDRYGLTRGL